MLDGSSATPQRSAAADCDGLAASRGQGTVEYVGIVIVVGVLLVAVKAGIGKSGAHDIAAKISSSVTQAVQDVVGAKGKSG